LPAIHQHLPARAAAAGEARQHIRDLNGRLDADELQVAMLLTTELIANSVLHSGTPPGETIALLVDLKDDGIRVEVHDNGPGFELGEESSRSPDSHWGLEIVEGLSNRWGVSRNGHGTVVWFELDRAVL
jgi:anti-sigma regulatory factor (Ser/Thr protein kinase)